MITRFLKHVFLIEQHTPYRLDLIIEFLIMWRPSCWLYNTHHDQIIVPAFEASILYKNQAFKFLRKIDEYTAVFWFSMVSWQGTLVISLADDMLFAATFRCRFQHIYLFLLYACFSIIRCCFWLFAEISTTCPFVFVFLKSY